MTMIETRDPSASVPLEEREGSFTWANETLRECAMPREDVRALLAADDPEIVRRRVELHREWLGERLAEQRRTLAGVERVLRGAIAAKRWCREERTDEFLGRSMSNQTRSGQGGPV